MSLLLDLQDIHTYYGKNYILKGISLSINEREIVACIGRNGAGKTTTIRSIMGIVPPRQGKILYKGEDIIKKPIHEISRKGIKLVPDDKGTITNLSVIENLRLAMLKSRYNATQEREILTLVYNYFPILFERRHQKAGTLSGGEQQMLAIARSLVANPNLLLIDEPTEGLMPSFVQRIREILKRINEQGTAILICEQNARFVASLASRVYILEQGSIVWQGSSKEISENEDIQRRYLAV